MNLEHIFEIIYSECHPNTEEYLKSPLDTESKPVVFMEQFEKIYFECNIEPLFEQILREMADYYYNNGKELIDKYTRSNNSNSIKSLLTFIFVRQLGENIGVRYHDVNKQSISVDNCFLSIINDLSNKADEAQKKNLKDLKILFSTALTNLRNSGWKENAPFPKNMRKNFQNIINNTVFSIIQKSQKSNKD